MCRRYLHTHGAELNITGCIEWKQNVFHRKNHRNFRLSTSQVSALLKTIQPSKDLERFSDGSDLLFLLAIVIRNTRQSFLKVSREIPVTWYQPLRTL
ncbi:hypothetical protein NPIL_649081 [Nephila pilipes]|uniref:Uncharacterized protein n=1 Tax=Nephila pilipes TaxID=299642 RepID=A0A8X6NR47_NEPPI|nr:hypothetical protein NPIL_649081 [Nephila pilipes]